MDKLLLAFSSRTSPMAKAITSGPTVTTIMVVSLTGKDTDKVT